MDGYTDSHMSDSDGFHPNITAGRSPDAVKLFINACCCLPVMKIFGGIIYLFMLLEKENNYFCNINQADVGRRLTNVSI